MPPKQHQTRSAGVERLGLTSDPVRKHSIKELGASLLRNAPNQLKRKSMALETYFAASAAALPAIRPNTMMSV